VRLFFYTFLHSKVGRGEGGGEKKKRRGGDVASRHEHSEKKGGGGSGLRRPHFYNLESMKREKKGEKV